MVDEGMHDSVCFIGYIECAQGAVATYSEIPAIQVIDKMKTYKNNQGERIVVCIGKQTLGGIARYDYFIKFTTNGNNLTMFQCPYPNLDDGAHKMELLQDIAITDDYVCLSSVSEEPGISMLDVSGNNKIYHTLITRRFDRNNFAQKTFWDVCRYSPSDYTRGYGVYDAKLEHTFGNEIALSYTSCVNSNGIGTSTNPLCITNNYYYNALFRMNLTSNSTSFNFEADYLNFIPLKIDSSDTELRVKSMAFIENGNSNNNLMGNLVVLKECHGGDDAVFNIPCNSEGYSRSVNPHGNSDIEIISMLRVPSSVYERLPNWNHIIKSGTNHFSLIGVTKESIFNATARTWWGKLSIFDKSLNFSTNSCNKVESYPIRYLLYAPLYLSDPYYNMLPDSGMPITTHSIDTRKLDEEEIKVNCQN